MRIGIIGCGNMGGAIARIFSKSHEVFLHDHKKSNATSLEKEIEAKIELDLKKLAASVEAIVLAVKPKDLKTVADEIGSHLANEQIIISILAGKTLETLKKHFPKASVFRVMPNLPLLCGHGMLGIVDRPAVSQEMKQQVESILKDLGSIFWLKEEQFNAFTVLTSSNPAFISLIIEAMVQAGVSLGFKSDVALEYLLPTFEGLVALIKHTKLSPHDLKMRIASPAGATIAGLNELENKGVRAGIIAGIEACYLRALEMGA